MVIFHNTEAQQINFADERFYLAKNGVTYYPSVTEILSVYPKGYGFQDWLKQVGYNADIVVTRAAEEGSKIHDTIDNLINGIEIIWDGKNYTIDQWKMVVKFMDFWNKNQPVKLINEVSFCSETLGFGGTIDLVCEIAGKRWLIDFKSSNYIHTSHELQLAAYAMLWNETNPGYRIDNTGILHLKAATRGEDKKGINMQGRGWQVKQYDRHYEDAFAIFKHTQAIWKEENPNYKPANLILPDRFKIETNKKQTA